MKRAPRLVWPRLLLYLIAVALPAAHPGVVVYLDRAGIILLFALIPGQMLLGDPGFLPKVRRMGKPMIAALFTLLAMLIARVSYEQIPLFLLASVGALLSSFLLYAWRIRFFSVFEPFAFVYAAYTLLQFSRASEDLARMSSGITNLLVAIGAAGFVLYFLVLYRSWHPATRIKRRELLILSVILCTIGVSFVLLLPPDFLEHEIVGNLLEDPVKPQFSDIEGETDSPLEGNLRGNRESEGNDPDGEGQGRLKGLNAEDWSQGSGQGQGQEGNADQYTVMVVAAERQSLYLADQYRDNFDAEAGFHPAPDQPYNQLPYRTLIETWKNSERTHDSGRRSVSVFTLSTLKERTLAWLPFSVEPTILDRTTYPLMYSYQAVSLVAPETTDLPETFSDYSEEEWTDLSPWISIPLSDEDRAAFETYLATIVDPKADAGTRIRQILQGFSQHQYNLGFEEDVSVARMREFLTETREGDCTEFSNSAAILGRLAGVPSRVVTGYLASRGLQTMKHVQGAYQLQQNIPRLQDYPLEQLFLVTTAHRHSWVQFYLPRYGWVDFESTEYAIPPPPGGDFNSSDVVIPILKTLPETPRSFRFPWRTVGRLALLLFGIVVAGLYCFKIGLILVLRRQSGRDTARGVRALYRLLLLRLACRGYALKPAGATARDFAERYPITSDFAVVYTQLAYGNPADLRKRDMLRLREEYARVMRESGGLLPLLRELFALRGLHY